MADGSCADEIYKLIIMINNDMSNLDFYDKSTGIYYHTIFSSSQQRGMLSKKSGSHRCNLGIYLPDKDRNLLFFDEGENHKISEIFMETAVKDKKVRFNGSDLYDSHIKNNHVSDDHIVNDTLLIATSDDDNHQTQIWIANKDGSDKYSLKTFSSGFDWHIDVKNSKIRIVTANSSEFSVESFDW